MALSPRFAKILHDIRPSFFVVFHFSLVWHCQIGILKITNCAIKWELKPAACDSLGGI